MIFERSNRDTETCLRMDSSIRQYWVLLRNSSSKDTAIEARIEGMVNMNRTVIENVWHCF